MCETIVTPGALPVRFTYGSWSPISPGTLPRDRVSP